MEKQQKNTKDLKMFIAKSSVETISLAHDIESLINVAIDYCKYNSNSDTLYSLAILLNAIEERAKKLSATLDNNTIQFLNF